MGLAGRKEKQRIGPDPRNLTWAQDNSRFGQQYLAKFGWTPESGSGLGANGDGRLAHISVAQKLNLLGIGGPTAGANDPDAIAWKQNKEFESVLKRLNGEEEEKMDQALLHGFVRGEITESTIEEQRPSSAVTDEPLDEKRRRKEEKRRRKAQALADQGTNASAPVESQTPEVSPSAVTPTNTDINTVQKIGSGGSMGPRMAHRAKFRASKQLASLSSTALSEILGVTPSSASGSATPNVASQGASTPAVAGAPPTGREDQLKTSTTSVADYFAAKMKARQLGAQLASEPQTPLDVEMASPDEEQEDGKVKEAKKEKKKRKRELESGEDAIVVDEVVNDEPKRRKEKKDKESKKKRRKGEGDT